MIDSPERIARWMRVPEAWAALKAIEPEIAAGIDTPAALADRMRAARHTSAPTPMAWEAARATTSAPPSDFNALLDQVEALCDADARGLYGEVAQAISAQPDSWRSALALAWPRMTGQAELARALVGHVGSAGPSVLANAMLTTHTAGEAAVALQAALGEHAATAVMAFAHVGEHALAQSLAQLLPETPPLLGNRVGAFSEAARSASLGNLNAARQALVDDWDRALDACAAHGDRLADIALAEGDPVSAVEALKQALTQQPNRERMARLAVVLAKSGRPDEARAWVTDSPQTAAERIAAAVVTLSLDQPHLALAQLRQAVMAVGQEPTMAPDWLDSLAGALESAGQYPEAARLIERIVRWHPADSALRLRLAEALVSAGDPSAAVDHAQAAMHLQPESAAARRCLARSLRLIGRSDEALVHWQAIDTPDDEDHLETARCAIAAGKIDVATHVAETLITARGASAVGLALLGRALMAAGRHAEARERLEAACAADPRDPEAWTALAECQAALGDPQAVASTLAAAAQAAPGSAPVQHAYAAWLRTQGRTSEALQAAAKAAADPSASPEFILQHGELLVELGHFDQAAGVLHALLAKRPGSWPVRRALAQAQLSLGLADDASDLVGHLPDDADDAARAFAGHVLVSRASASGDTTAARRALTHLQRAFEKNPHPEIQIDMARAMQVLGDTEQALDHYRAGIDQPVALSAEVHKTASMGLARCAIELNRVPLAIHALEAAAARHGASADLHIALSAAYAAAGQHRRALEAAQRAAELTPDEAALRQLTSAASQAGECGLAMHAIQRLAALQPDSPHVWLTLAEISAQSQDESQARASLARGLRLAKADAAAWSHASDLLQRLGRAASAQRALRKALYAAPQDAGLVRKLAELSAEAGDATTAQRAWMRYADLCPDQPEELERSARALWLLNQRAVAVGLWQRAVALAPEHLDAHLDLARAYLTEGDAVRALDHYRRVAQSRGDDLGLILEAAAAELHYGTLAKAIDLFQAATTIAPRDVAGWVALGEGLLLSGRAHEARQALEAAQRLEPANVHVLATLAVAALDAGDAAGAAVFHASALRQACDGAASAAALARASIALGRWDAALTTLDRLNAASPSLASLRASIEARLRLADAHWMYQAAGSRVHGPSAEATGDSAHNDVEALLVQLAALAPAWEADRLRQRTAACYGPEVPVPALEMLGRDPSGETLEGLAVAWLRLGRPADALAVLNSDAAHCAGRWHGLLSGMAHMSLGDLEDARQSFAGAAADATLRPLAEHLIAQTDLAADDEQAYAEHASNALVQWNDEPVWHFELAQVYLKNGQPDAALPHLAQAADSAPEVSEYALTLARTAMEAGDLAAALAGYVRVATTMPTDGQAWRDAGLCALAAGDTAAAIEWLEHARRLLPGDVDCLVASAQASLAADDTREAHEHAQAAYHLAPERADVLLVLGEVMARQGKLDKALQSFDRALKRSDDPLSIQIARGRLLVQIGRGEQAIEMLKAAVSKDPESDAGWAALASMQEAAGQLPEAVDSAARAVQCAPDRVAHRLALGRLCRKTGHLDRALDELLRALAAGRAEAQVSFELGRVYEERREFKRSLDAYQRAIDADSSNGEAHFHAGLVLKQIKAYPQAGRMLKRAVELNPKDPEALHQLAAVRALELVHGGISHQVVAP